MRTLSRNFAVGAIALLALPMSAITRGPVNATEAVNAAEDSKTAAQVWADAKAAMVQARSFHVLGHDDQQGTDVTVNLSMSPGRGGGSIQEPGVVMELVLAKGIVYVKADEKSWFKLTHSQSTAELVANRWIEAPVTNADFASFAQLADSTKFLGTITAPKGQITKLPGTSTWDGRKAVVLEDATGDKLYIADTGTPYMLAAKSSGTGGSLTFTDFGDAPMPAVPTNALSLPGM